MRRTPLHPLWILLLGVHCLGLLTLFIPCINYFSTPVHRPFDPMAPCSFLPPGIPSSLFNCWNKLVRYQHHSDFLDCCVSKSRIPPGLLLNFNLELMKDDTQLQATCNHYLYQTSFNIVKAIAQASKNKIKDLQRDLASERNKLYLNFDTTTADEIWTSTKRKLHTFNYELKLRERNKFRKTIKFTAPITTTGSDSIHKRPNRRFQKHLKNLL